MRTYKNLTGPEGDRDLAVGDRVIFEDTGEMGTVEQKLPKDRYCIRLLSGRILNVHKSRAHFLPTPEQIKARAKAIKEMRWGRCA